MITEGLEREGTIDKTLPQKPHSSKHEEPSIIDKNDQSHFDLNPKEFRSKYEISEIEELPEGIKEPKRRNKKKLSASTY